MSIAPTAFYDDVLRERAERVRTLVDDLQARDREAVLVLSRFVGAAEVSRTPTFLPLNRERPECRDLRACRHPSKSVNEQRHRVVCTTCGAILNSFDVLLELSRRHDDIQRVDQDRQRLIKEVEALRADVDRLKAARRRAEKSGGGAR